MNDEETNSTSVVEFVQTRDLPKLKEGKNLKQGDSAYPVRPGGIHRVRQEGKYCGAALFNDSLKKSRGSLRKRDDNVYILTDF